MAKYHRSADERDWLVERIPGGIYCTCWPFPCCDREKLRCATPFPGCLKETAVKGRAWSWGCRTSGIASLVAPRSAVTVIDEANDGKISSAVNRLCIRSLRTAKGIAETPLPFTALSLTYSRINIILFVL